MHACNVPQRHHGCVLHSPARLRYQKQSCKQFRQYRHMRLQAVAPDAMPYVLDVQGPLESFSTTEDEDMATASGQACVGNLRWSNCVRQHVGRWLGRSVQYSALTGAYCCTFTSAEARRISILLCCRSPSNIAEQCWLGCMQTILALTTYHLPDTLVPHFHFGVQTANF